MEIYNKNKLYYGVLTVLEHYDNSGITATTKGHRIDIFTLFNKKSVFNVCEEKKYALLRFPSSFIGIHQMIKCEGKEVVGELVPLNNVLNQFGIECNEDFLTTDQLIELREKLKVRYDELLEERRNKERSIREQKPKEK